MRISVVIPTFDRKDTLKKCLQGVTNQNYPDYEVLVIDDASTDGTAEMVQEKFPQVCYFRQETNRGPAAARNRGIESSTGEIIIFTDDDCVPPTSWLTGHASYYEDSKIGAVGGPQTPRNPNIFDKFDIAHYAEQFYGEVRIIEEVASRDFLGSNNMSIRREALDKSGVFDTKFLLPAGEDFDLSKRLVSKGYHLIIDPNLQVEHLKVHNLKSYLRMRFRRGYGCIASDLKERSVSIRQFFPFPNLVLAWKSWQNFVDMFGSDFLVFFQFWSLVFLNRWVVVAGRLYYYPKIKDLYDNEQDGSK